jgi:ribosomal-protein-serine acetyltransferase
VNPIRWDLGDGLVLRTWTPDDADDVFAVVDANRERLRRWLPFVDLTTEPAHERAFIERSLASETDLEANGIYLDGDLVGGMGMSVDPLSNSGEIGYWLDEQAEGHGLVTRTCREMMRHAFEVMSLHRLTIHAATSNARSRAVAERLGFTQEGVLREAGLSAEVYQDLAVYGLLRDEWTP